MGDPLWEPPDSPYLSARVWGGDTPRVSPEWSAKSGIEREWGEPTRRTATSRREKPVPFPTLWRSDPALVGRQRELATLEQQLAAALAGRTAVVLLAGEPGVGKTRLLTAVGARATAAGALVRWGGASDAEGMPPYLPFLEALGQHIRAAAPEDLQTQIGPLAGILGTILPELAFRLGDLPPSYPLPPEQARLRLYEAVGSFLAAIASARPLLLLLDDLHWADPASLDLLAYVVRHQPAARLLVLGAYRPGEAESNPAFGRAVGELSRQRALQTVTVGPLAEDEVATLASAALGAPLDQAARTVLFAHSEGNPFLPRSSSVPGSRRARWSRWATRRRDGTL